MIIYKRVLVSKFLLNKKIRAEQLTVVIYFQLSYEPLESNSKIDKQNGSWITCLMVNQSNFSLMQSWSCEFWKIIEHHSFISYRFFPSIFLQDKKMKYQRLEVSNLEIKYGHYLVSIRWNMKRLSSFKIIPENGCISVKYSFNLI